jgi:hypothetical protein
MSSSMSPSRGHARARQNVREGTPIQKTDPAERNAELVTAQVCIQKRNTPMLTTNETNVPTAVPKRLTGGRPASITSAHLNDILARHSDGWSYRQNAKFSRVSVSTIVRLVQRARAEGALLP